MSATPHTHRRAVRRAFLVAAALIVISLPLNAQMTIQGQVRTASGTPVGAAVVSIPSLDLDTRTTENGRYSFIIRSMHVRGQAARVVARHARFGSASAEVQIVGGAIVRDFVLAGGAPDTSLSAFAGLPWPGVTEWERNPHLVRSVVDTATLAAPVGPVDVVSALAGRIPGFTVTGAAGPGGSAPAFYRGPRSIVGHSQPLVVVDGVVLDNDPIARAFQRFGLGGFDYGSPAQRLPLDEVESVVLLHPAAAALLYGSRAGNGVLVVTTKSGRKIEGVHLSAEQWFTMESPTRLPIFQNEYGQGLDGQYEFFDGRGGGINDDVAESWGPRLDGRPMLQHSVTEAGRPDVRQWLSQPDDIRNYFSGGRTLGGNAAVLGSLGWSSFRAAVNARDATGLTPSARHRQLGVALNGTVRPMRAFEASTHFRMLRSTARNRPGTGLHELNPVAGFARMGRQVDLDALQRNVVDENGAQINWIYTGRNNPFFATSRNANDDRATDMFGGADLSYGLSSWMRLGLHITATQARETRRVALDSGWLGGYPGFTSATAFGGGGTDEQSITRGERSARLSTLLSTLRGDYRVFGAAGTEFRVNEFTSMLRAEEAAPTTAAAIGDTLSARGTNQSWFLMTGIDRGAGSELALLAGARVDQATARARASSTGVYPFISATYDVASRFPFFRAGRLESLIIRGSWWQAGTTTSDAARQSHYYGGGTTGIIDDGNGPEKTAGLEFGVDVGMLDGRLSFGVGGYRERSTALLVASPLSPSTAQVDRSGEIFNSGYEMELDARLLRRTSWDWSLAASFANNTNTVDALLPDVSSVPLSPGILGARQIAQVGYPLGTIVGTRYLRDESGALLLRDGLPIADASAPLSLLGTWQPDWTAGVQTRFRYRDIELHVLADTRRGGSVFSGTNLTGGEAGTLAFTAPDREDGVIVAGVDSVTGAANATRVSVQDYYHALAGIHEAWVFDASMTRLREARLTWTTAGGFLGFPQSRLRMSVIGRNLLTFSGAPNIDPETAFSTGPFQGFEMGQLPNSKSLGIAISLSP